MYFGVPSMYAYSIWHMGSQLQIDGSFYFAGVFFFDMYWKRSRVLNGWSIFNGQFNYNSILCNMKQVCVFFSSLSLDCIHPFPYVRMFTLAKNAFHETRGDRALY